MTDPVTDTIGDRIEEKIRDVLLASADLTDLKVVYRGDPYVIPTRLHPFAIVAVLVEYDSAGDKGYGAETGPITYWKFEGVVQIEVLARDTTEKQLVPDETRRADVGSYRIARRLTQAARQAVLGWAGPDGGIPLANRVTSADTKETTLLLEVGRIENGLAVQSRTDNVTNAGTFAFTIYTRREEF